LAPLGDFLIEQGSEILGTYPFEAYDLRREEVGDDGLECDERLLTPQPGIA
jgi:hypothetical protein